MNLFSRRGVLTTTSGTADFDQLRSRLEADIVRPAVIAITSAGAEDGKGVAARRLADSLATAGYATLFVDSSISRSEQNRALPGPTLEDIGRTTAPGSGTGNLVGLVLSDAFLQKTSSQRHIRATLDTFRGKFDYIIFDTEQGLSTPFATSVVDAADAVLVTVKTGRRETAADSRLSVALSRSGSRFLGVLALAPSVTTEDKAITGIPSTKGYSRRGQAALVEKDVQRRDVAERPA